MNKIIKNVTELGLATVIALGCVALGCASSNPDEICLSEAKKIYTTGCGMGTSCQASGSVTDETICQTTQVNGEDYCCTVTVRFTDCKFTSGNSCNGNRSAEVMSAKVTTRGMCVVPTPAPNGFVAPKFCATPNATPTPESSGN
jgi:hypothetical protein